MGDYIVILGTENGERVDNLTMEVLARARDVWMGLCKCKEDGG
jgi:hypothetical protein